MANTASFLRRQSSRDMHQQTTAKTLDNLELKVGGENLYANEESCLFQVL